MGSLPTLYKMLSTNRLAKFLQIPSKKIKARSKAVHQLGEIDKEIEVPARGDLI